jgi:integrase
MTQSPRLLDQVRQTIRLKHFSLQTEKYYVYYITQFILFHNKRHPRDMGVDEIRAYLSHLAVALSALLFLDKQVFQSDLPYIDRIGRAKKPRRLPVVYSRAEAKAILANLEGTTYSNSKFEILKRLFVFLFRGLSMIY